jgi:hypothetical protein
VDDDLGVLKAIDRHLAGLRAAVASLVPDQLTGPDAARLVERGVEIERLGAATCTRYARRVAETKAYDGYTSAANWLAAKTGESTGAAQGVLDVAEQLAEAPLVDQAFSDGRLSLAQAKVVAGAGAVDPASQAQLIGSATRQSFRELVDDARRIRRRALGEATEAAKEARAHRRRYVRVWAPDEGGLRLEAWLPRIDGARVKAVLEDEANRVGKEAHAAGRREPAPAYLADALVHVVCGDAASRPKAHVELRVDAAALRRGEVDGDEVCEIPGVGSVPVGVARDVLGDSAFRLVVTDGTDVRTVTSRKRTIREPLRAALRERDGGCAVPGCPNTRYLEIDHDWELSRGGPTQLDNLQLLCTHHHRLKTAFGFRLVRGPDGTRRWVTPPGRGAVSPTTAPGGRRSAGAGRPAPSRAAADRRR